MTRADTPDTKGEALVVTQADREAAASATPMGRGTKKAIRAGDCDHLPLVQAFARHRLSHPPQPAIGEVERLREAVARVRLHVEGKMPLRRIYAQAWEQHDWHKDIMVLVRAALSQPPAVATPAADAEVPAGWKLVPVEPTEAMLDAALKAYSDRTAGMSDDARNRLKHALRLDWSAMLAASPKAPAVAIGAGEVGRDCAWCGHATNDSICPSCVDEATREATGNQDPRPDRNCDYCGPGWKDAHKHLCPRAHEDYNGGGPVDD